MESIALFSPTQNELLLYTDVFSLVTRVFAVSFPIFSHSPGTPVSRITYSLTAVSPLPEFSRPLSAEVHFFTESPPSVDAVLPLRSYFQTSHQWL